MPDVPSQTSIGLPFIELQTIDSTNNYALSRIHAGLAQHGLSIFSHEQTSGKGQRGKKWVSDRSLNVALSIVIRPSPLSVTEQFQLSACAAVSLHQLFTKYAGEETKIKWPNDLYWNDRKAGGILIESIVRSRDSGAGNWEWAVIGFGININQTSFAPDLPNPVSLTQVTGKQFDSVVLAKELCRIFHDRFEQLIHEGFEDIYARYISSLYKLNEKVKLKKGSRVFETMIKSVSPSGQLIVQHGMEEEFDFGSVEWVIGE